MGFLNLFESCLPRLKTTLREREIEPKNNNIAAQTQTLKLKHFWSREVSSVCAVLSGRFTLV